MRIKGLLLMILLGITSTVQAQDPVFTQYFMVPQTLDPGFTGIYEDWHAGLLHRTQWPNQDRQIDTDFGFVNKLIGLNSGLGVTLLSNREKFTHYSLSQINGTYSYAVELNDYWYFRPAIEVGFGVKNFNFGNLVLEDQINRETGAISPMSIDPTLRNRNINFIDFTAGMLFTTENLWLGATLKHINRPDISFTGNDNVPLEMFLSMHGMYEFDFLGRHPSFFPDNSRIIVTANYMQQGEYNRLDAGAALVLHQWSLGATVATNPNGKSNNSHFLTSVNPFVSIRMLDHFVFGCSYDANTSKLGNTHGVFEIGLTYQADIDLNCQSCPNYLVKLPR
jgi:type IX secretion system PorP/SprF family membrane protein